jgi:hypothetical protein
MDTSRIVNRQRALITSWTNTADPTLKGARGQLAALAYNAALLEEILAAITAARIGAVV